MPEILLTRPKEQSERFAQDLRARFGPTTPIVASPLLEIRFLPVDIDLAGVDGLIFTSENGVRAYQSFSGQPCVAYCVGERTAKAARSLGLDAVSADGNLQDLVHLLEVRAKGQRLLHIRGKVTTADIVSPMLQVDAIVAYDQVAVPLSADAIDLLQDEKCVIVPLFSPRSARLFHAEINGLSVRRLSAVCISEAVASALSLAEFDRVAVSARMDGGAMIDEMAQLIG